ncbi:MAG: M28 family peptidase, partial [Candidatus Thorarchaeota archaeon]
MERARASEGKAGKGVVLAVSPFSCYFSLYSYSLAHTHECVRTEDQSGQAIYLSSGTIVYEGTRPLRFDTETFVKEFASGPRVSGTEGEERALSLLEDCVRDIGFWVRREVFVFQGSFPLESHLEIGNVRYEVMPVGYSISGEIKGNIAFAESLEPDMLLGLSGRIVVYPDYFYQRKEYDSLVSCKVAGALFGLSDRLVDAPNYTMFWEKWLESGRLVAATIDKQSLYRIKPHDEAFLVSHVEEKRVYSANLVWDLDVEGDEEIYMFAHHDSVRYSWGVTDNACGVAVLLRVCELLKKEHLRRNVIFCTFGAEEPKGAAGGSREYLRKHLHELESRGTLAINIGVQGHKLGFNRAYCNTQGLVDMMEMISHESNYPISMELRCVGPLDSFFFQRYVPTITFQRQGYYSHCRLGNRLDIVDYCSIER